MNFTGAGTLMHMDDLIDLRKKKGQCVTCGRQTHIKKMFKMIPLTVSEEVLDGRCLLCNPLDSHNKVSLATATHKLIAVSRASQAFHSVAQEPQLTNKESIPLQRHEPETTVPKSKSSRTLFANTVSTRQLMQSKEASRMHRASIAIPSQRHEPETTVPEGKSSRTLFANTVSTRQLSRFDVTPKDSDLTMSNREFLQSNEAPRLNRASVVSRLDSSAVIQRGESNRNINVDSNDDCNINLTSGYSDNITRESDLTTGSSQSNKNRTEKDDRNAESSLDEIANATGRANKQYQLKITETPSNPDHPHTQKKVNDSQPHDTKQDALTILPCLSNPKDVIQVMLENPHASLVQIEACRILSTQVPPSYNAMLLCGEQESLFRAILDAINHHQADESVQEMAHKLLSIIPFAQEEEISSLESYGGLNLILTSMKDFPENAKLQQYGCTTLSKISLFERIALDFLQRGGISVLVCEMTTHSLDAVIQEMACRTLFNMCCSVDMIKDAVSADGGVDSICIAMAMHPTVVHVQELGCRTLRVLSANNEENKVKIEASGGIDAIITAMQVHRGDANLQKEACWVLSNLAINSNNKVVIGESSGIDVIINAMLVHQNDAELQELACRTMWTLSVDPQNKELIAQAFGIKRVIAAMQDHADHAGVQEKGCGCLANLAANSEENKRLVVEEEGIDAIVLAMVMHPEERLVQEKAVNCLRKLACEPYLDTLRASGVVTLVELAGEKFPSNCRLAADQVLQLLL